jgi:hypothetical protein
MSRFFPPPPFLLFLAPRELFFCTHRRPPSLFTDARLHTQDPQAATEASGHNLFLSARGLQWCGGVSHRSSLLSRPTPAPSTKSPPAPARLSRCRTPYKAAIEAIERPHPRVSMWRRFIQRLAPLSARLSTPSKKPAASSPDPRPSMNHTPPWSGMKPSRGDAASDI